MSPALIAQLVLVLAPLLKDIAIEGEKLFITLRQDWTQDDMNKAVENAKSATWPELTFQ